MKWVLFFVSICMLLVGFSLCMYGVFIWDAHKRVRDNKLTDAERKRIILNHRFGR